MHYFSIHARFQVYCAKIMFIFHAQFRFFFQKTHVYCVDQEISNAPLMLNSASISPRTSGLKYLENRLSEWDFQRAYCYQDVDETRVRGWYRRSQRQLLVNVNAFTLQGLRCVQPTEEPAADCALCCSFLR